MKYIPRHDFVLVQLITMDKSKDGVVLPSISQEAKKWKVVAMGPEVSKFETVTSNIKEGSVVILGGPVEGKGNDYLMYQIPGSVDMFLVKDRNIIGIETKESTWQPVVS